MMIGAILTAPVSAVAVIAFRMSGIDKALRHDTPLDGGIGGSAERKTFVDAPAHRTVVDNEILAVEGAKCIPAVSAVDRHVLIAETEAHEADDYIIGFYAERIVRDADSVSAIRT